MKANQRPGQRGLSLIELLVCMGMMVVLTVMLAMIYSSSYSTFRRGTSRMSVTQRAREVLRRITPMVMCAKAPTELEEAVISPAIGATGDFLEFYSADNVLVEMQPVNARNPTHYRFRITLEPDRTVRVRRLELGGAVTGDEKILAYNVEEIHFERLAVNLVNVRAITDDRIRNAINQEEQLKVERSAVVAIPYYSSTR